MNIKIIEKKNNKLLNRTEVSFTIDSYESTPKRLEVKNKLSALVNSDESLIIINRIDQETGMRKSKGIAHVYKTREELESVEPKYLINRNTPPKTESKS
ncbi:MAG: 30S ribosomal protein S24e [Asgard group archaeon]|nr:30S ribosomal protein S24e [Asgard group archaeon]